MYCRITYKRLPGKNRGGDYVLGSRALNVGQTAACEVQVPGCDGLEPETMAAILPSGNGKGWNLVRRTDCYDMAVNGKRVGIACGLSHGDELSFMTMEGERLAVMGFEVHEDGECDMKTGVIYGHRKKSATAAWIGSAAGIIAVCIALFSLYNRETTISYEELRGYEESVYQIRVDSVSLVYRDGGREHVVESIGLERVEKGTCFLTDEGLIVTARHCIEPWVEAGRHSAMTDMAIYAETMNRALKEEKYFLRSECIVNYEGEELVFSSTDFRTNRSRDKIINIGDYSNPKYFRTITPIARRRDMELGDFAYLKTEYAGSISLATAEEIETVTEYSDVVIFGYPGNDNDTDNKNMARGLFQHNDGGGCLQMSSSDIVAGYSGGPVFTVIKGKIKAVGLVSKVDSRDDKATFWVVPSAEVLDYKEAGEDVRDESFIYRR